MFYFLTVIIKDMVAFEPIIGGLVSGAIAGAGTVELRYRRNKHQMLRKWYNRTKRLAQRVHRVDYGDDWTGPKPFIVRATCAGVHSEMASHLADAPPSVDDNIFNLADHLVSECQIVKMMGREELARGDWEQPEIRFRVEQAAERARQVEEAARKEREEVSFL